MDSAYTGGKLSDLVLFTSLSEGDKGGSTSETHHIKGRFRFDRPFSTSEKHDIQLMTCWIYPIECEIEPRSSKSVRFDSKEINTSQWSGLLHFIPAWSDDELHITEPDSFGLDFFLPEDAFRSLYTDIEKGMVEDLGLCFDILGIKQYDINDWLIWKLKDPEIREKLKCFSLELDYRSSSSILDHVDYEEVREKYVKSVFPWENDSDEKQLGNWGVGGVFESISFCIARYAEEVGLSGKEFHRHLSRAEDMLLNFSFASNQNRIRWNTFFNKKNEVRDHPPAWRHRNIEKALREGLDSEEACDVYREEIDEIAIRYLQQPWHCVELEILIVDALVGSETYTFGKSIMESPSQYSGRFSITETIADSIAYYNAKGKLNKLAWTRPLTRLAAKIVGILFSVAFFIVAPGFGFYKAIEHGYDDAGIVGGAVWYGMIALYLAVNALRWLGRVLRGEKKPIQKTTELFIKMLNAYKELADRPLSPTRTREVLSACANEGCKWNPSVFAILDRAIQRDPGYWH